MANHLARFGVVPRKSRVTFLPILERRLMPHLIRGIFDGDGTASHRSDGGLLLGFCGSERLITELRIWFISCLVISANTIHRVNSAFVVQWTARDDVRSIAAYLYSDASVFLERKRRLVKGLL